MNLTGLKFGNLTSFVTTYVKAHHVRRGGFVAAAAAAALVFFVLGAFIRLLVGPVSLGPFSDRIQEALANALPGLTVRYDQAALEWSREDGRINLVVLGARVFDPEGRIIAQAPKAELALAAGPLLQGNVELRRIALIGVQLTLVRTKEGELRLGVEKGHGNSDIIKRITDAINASNTKQSSLQSFAVRDARLAFFDEGSGLFVVAPSTNLQVATAGHDLAATLDADIEIAGSPSHVKLDLKLPNGNAPISGAIEFKGLSLDALGSNARAFETLKGIKLTTDLTASFVMGPKNSIAFVDFGIGATGSVAVRGLIHGPLRVKELRAVGKYDGRAGRVLFDDLELSSSGAVAEGQGKIDIARERDGTIREVRYDFSTDKISVNMPGIFMAPFHLGLAAIRGSYAPAPDRIAIEHFVISGGTFQASGGGTITRAGDASPAIQMQAGIGAMAVRDLLRYWPKPVAGGAWEWVNKNMKTGRVGPIAAVTHISAGALDGRQLPEEAVTLTVPVSGVTMTYFHKLTQMTDVQGTIKLTGDTFAADVKGGRIGTLMLSNGKVMIANLHADENFADIAAQGEGRLSDILTLIDMDPLHYATRFHLDPKDTVGSAKLNILFRVPTRDNATDKDIRIDVKAALKGVDLALTEHTRITDGSIDLAVDNNHLNANGNVALFGSRLAVNWNETFETPKGVLSSQIAVKGTLDDTAREGLNFHSGQFLKGTVGVTATLGGDHGSIRHADMTMDVTPATLTVDYFGISKPPGIAGTAVVSATFDNNGTIQAETTKVTGPGVSAQGAITFDKEGSLAKVSFPSVHAGTINDFSFLMTESIVGGLDIQVRGNSVDGTHIGRRGTADVTATASPSDGKPEEESNAPFHFSAQVDHLVMRNNVTIGAFALDASGIGDRPKTLSMTGMLGKNAPLSANLTAGEGGRRITMDAGDAGTLLNGLFGFTSLKGGKLNVVATLPGRGDTPHPGGSGPEFQGTATITDFRIVDQPFLARLFSAGSLTGIAGLLGGRGIEFDKLSIPFASRNGIVTIREARASGGSLGMTADGYFDRPKGQIALRGSLVPIFGLNSILGAIPLLGDLLVSKKGEGIFGMTYTARGNAEEPDISVNPLSMLTPGIFRRIFEGRIPESAQTSQLPAPATPAPAPTPPPVPDSKPKK